MSTPKVSQSFTPNAHQVLLLEAPPLGGRATTPMVLAVDPIPHHAVARIFPSAMLSPQRGNQPTTKTRYLNVSARYILITTNRSNLTMNIWMHHI